MGSKHPERDSAPLALDMKSGVQSKLHALGTLNGEVNTSKAESGDFKVDV